MINIRCNVVKGLNESYTRFDFIVGGVCSILDGIVDIFSLGYFRLGLHIWHTRRTFKRGIKHLENKYNIKTD